MREIRFRGRDKATGKWVYGDLTHAQGITPVGSEKLTYPRVMVAGYEVDEETVGQFIGVYDKNGKEVFEGDVVDCWSQGEHCTNGIVRWFQNRIFIDINSQKGQSYDNWYICPDVHNIDGGLTVIGNVYDNSELAKGGNQ